MVPPGHPPYEPQYESTFEDDRAALHFTGANFDYFFEGIARTLRDYPKAESVEVPDGDGIRILPTYRSWPDLPRLYIFYRIQENPNRIVFLGMTPAWTQDLPPAGFES